MSLAIAHNENTKSVAGAGKHFDPAVVKAFVRAFEHGEMDLPNIMV
ncbi:hypothetical protein [Thermodesulfatator autotrophicus]|nr:hypothetical protein [Thermodesulfatator autotrophicus]